MPSFESLLQGFAGAAGDYPTVARIDEREQNRRKLADEERKANVGLYDQAIQGIQNRMGTLDPNSPDYKTLQGSLEKAVRARTALFRPQQAPSLGTQIGQALHLKKKTPPVPQPGPGDAAAALQAGAPSPAESNPFVLKKQQLKQAGFTDEQIEKIMEIDTGLQPKATSKSKLVTGELNGKTVTLEQIGPHEYTDTAGNPVDATGFVAKTVAPREVIEPDAKSPTGYSKVAYDPMSGKEISREENVLPPRGFVGSESTTTDPFGVTSKTVRKPIIPGTPSAQTGATKSTTPRQQATPLKPKVETPAPIPKTAGEAKQQAQTVAPKSGAKTLDKEGHIPADAKVNPMLREAANQLLDGKAMKDLQVPQRDKQAAAQLASGYGWRGEGMFTPQQMLLVRESRASLDTLSNDKDALSILDDQMSRLKVAQVLENPEKRGTVGQAVQVLTSANLNANEQKFVTLYNQAVGRISGLSQLVRSGRATEAQIERLKTELPSPFTTSSSAHAVQKLKQIQNEIDIALDKGSFSTGAGQSDDDFLKNF